VVPAGWREEQIPWLREINVFDANSPIVVPEDGLSINFRLSPELLELKVRALEEHASQFGPFVASAPKLAEMLIDWNQDETYVLAAVKR